MGCFSLLLFVSLEELKLHPHPKGLAFPKNLFPYTCLQLVGFLEKKKKLNLISGKYEQQSAKKSHELITVVQTWLEEHPSPHNFKSTLLTNRREPAAFKIQKPAPPTDSCPPQKERRSSKAEIWLPAGNPFWGLLHRPVFCRKFFLADVADAEALRVVTSWRSDI